MRKKDLKVYLDQAVLRYNTPSFVEDDPISLPYAFDRLQDIEIIAFWVSMLAWGQRKTIINSGRKLIEYMDGAPYDFIRNHKEHERARFEDFKHRTFQYTDTLYFLEFLQWYYQRNESLENAFASHLSADDVDVKAALIGFHELFFSLPTAPKRTRKHIATPARKSSCKRLNMFLRWMVRKDDKGVDFGLWHQIKMSQLMIPLDVHVERVARELGLLKRTQRDWKAVEELTTNLRALDPNDPVKYDFALFGLGVIGEH